MSDQVVAVVSSHAGMRLALCHCLDQLGYATLVLPAQEMPNPILKTSLAGNVNPATLARINAPSPWRLEDCSLAVVDLNDYGRESASFEQALEQVVDLPSLYLDQAPPESGLPDTNWCHQVAKKIARLHAEIQTPETSPDAAIWLLLGSTGGPEAVREFIDTLPVRSPIGFLYGQHINPGFENNLVSMLDGRRGLRAKIAETGDRLMPGYIHIAPPNQRLYVLEKDELLVENATWHGQFQPSLETLVVEYSQRPLPFSGVIVFSGMGEDGAAALRLYSSRGGHIWVQSPATCVVSSMPEAALANSHVEHNDTPEQLARLLFERYKYRRALAN